MAGALSLQPWQWGVLALAWVLLFAVPSVFMWRKAARDGDNPLVWSALVLVASFLGFYEYGHHRRILQRRAARAEKAKTRQAEAGGREER